MATTEKPPVEEAQFQPGELPPGITAEQVRSHVIAPEHTRGVRMEQLDPAKERRLDLSKVALPATPAPSPPPPPGQAQSNLGAFAAAIHASLKSSVVGYQFEVRKNGTKVLELRWNWAQTPIDANLGMNEDRRMHIASVSKLLTAIAMVKALDSNGISYDAKIGPYLPAYWSQGQNIGKITFRHLMTHTSGFSTAGSSDYAFMKARVAAGVMTTPGTAYDYENMNFGLCRILIPIVTGMISKNATWGFLQDVVWDSVTLAHYKNYMQANVFTPAGVANVGWAPAPGGILAYRQPHAGLHGWNSGDLASVAGGAGWRLSVKELLEVMNHMRRKSTIVSPQTAQKILDSRFGIDRIVDTPAGKLYDKNGLWWQGKDFEREQCVATFLPEGLEAVLFIDSRIGAQDYSPRQLVQDCYVNSLS